MILKNFMIIFVLSFGVLGLRGVTFAQNNSGKQITNELLDTRNKLEKDIQENLTNLIATQLLKESFTVAVRVQTQERPPAKKEKNETPKEEPPAGMDLGIIAAQEIIESYEKEIEELKLKKENINKESKPIYQIQRIEVLVGLNPIYGQDYFKKFEGWLKAKLRKDYGSIASASVNPLSNKLEEKKIEPEKDDPLAMKYLSLIFSALVLTLGLLFLGILLKSGLNKVATATKHLQIEPKGDFKIETLNAPDENLSDEKIEQLPEPRAENYNIHEQIDRLTKKIAFVLIEIGTTINDLVQVWIDSGDEGFMKTSLLVDTVLIAREKIMSETGSIAPLTIPLTEEIAKMYQENLSEAYRRIIDLEDDTKLNILETIYWDLVSVKTLGLTSLRRPFDFLQSISDENLNELLLTQSDQARSLAIMYLPSDKKENILLDLPEDVRENVVANALKQSQLSDKQIWDFDTSMKVTVINQSANPTEKLVNLFPRTIEVLKSLNILEEIRILRKVTPTLEDNGLILKQQFNTLAFIDEWKSEHLGKLIRIATSEEIVTLIRSIPESSDIVLAECSDKVKIIISDDLKLPEARETSRTISKLESLRSKWNKVAAAENLPMSKVIKIQVATKQVLNAA